MVYVIGVSSGIFGAAPPEERLQYAGLYKKAQYCITKGVQFVQIDLESISEFREPDLKRKMKEIEKLGVKFGIHSETRAFGVEVAELDSAIETDYKFGHQRLYEIIKRAADIGSKYVLIHSSESTPFLFLERTTQPASLVDYYGKPLSEFLEKNENKWIIDWLMGGKIPELVEKIFNRWQSLENKLEISENDIKSVLPSQDFIWREVIGYTLPEFIRRSIISIMEYFGITRDVDFSNLSDEQLQSLNRHIRDTIRSRLTDAKIHFFDYVRSRGLHYGPERIAYYIIAKHMEGDEEKGITQDSLWKNIVNSSLNFFAKDENKTVEEWLRSRGIKRLSIEDENFRRYNYLWVPAVSAKYIWGHLKNPEKKTYPDIEKLIKEKKVPLVLETPMAQRGIEEWLRLPNPIQIYYLAKEVGEDIIQIAMDFEHMLSIRLKPEKVIDALPEDGGKFVRVVHLGWPSTLAPAHIPIPLGSEQHVYLYKMLYKLRQKGFGKDNKEYYIIFERGGGPDPIRQSIIALRKIVENLEKDVEPDKLPLDFFGIGTGELASEERQLRAIEEHARDPLKGLIAIPEEEYTFLGRAAMARPAGAEKWKKEELK